MLKNYFIVAVRNLRNNRIYSFINVGGLAMGMTIAMFIGLWVYDELSFNKYHTNYDRIGQLWNGRTDPATSKIDGGVAMQYAVASALRNHYSQLFKHIVRAGWISEFALATGKDEFGKTGLFIDPEGIEMLSLKMIEGNYKSLDDQHSIILSKSTSKSLFGTEDPMNKAIRISNEMDVIVTGVYEDLPANSDFAAVGFFAPWKLWLTANAWLKNAESDWDNHTFPNYVELQPDVSFEQVNERIKDIYKSNVPSDFYATIASSKPFAQLFPMSKWHLYSEFEDGKPAGGRITFVWLFGIVGVFVLLLACINFVNLSTARSERRAREVGVRKSIGSSKRQLIAQFLGESLMVVTLSFILSILLLVIFQHSFNQLSGKDIHLPFSNIMFWSVALGFVFITGVTSGLYPAFYLSSFQPVKVLKGT